MHGWSRSRKRLLLAVMLLPAPAIVAMAVAISQIFDSGDPDDPAFNIAFACWGVAFLSAYGGAIACIVDAVRGRVAPTDRGGWIVALLLGATVAGPAYWWLHVRPAEGEPHGLRSMRPATAWPPRAKAVTGVASALTFVLTIGWFAWISSLALGAEPAAELPALVGFAVLTVVACAVIGVLFLDALRAGGTHAWLWATLLVFAWPVAAPLYWFLFVRPTARLGGGP